MKQKFPISRFLGGRITSEQSRAIKRFLGKQHEFQCKIILGEKFEQVHKEMDKERGGGKKHRKYGHNEKFIKQKFKGRNKSAANIHLLGDFALDILPDVLDYVLKNIKKNKIKLPCYLPFENNQSSWDVTENAIREMTKKWGKVFINTLKIKKNRKVQKQ